MAGLLPWFLCEAVLLLLFLLKTGLLCDAIIFNIKMSGAANLLNS